MLGRVMALVLERRPRQLLVLVWHLLRLQALPRLMWLLWRLP